MWENMSVHWPELPQEQRAKYYLSNFRLAEASFDELLGMIDGAPPAARRLPPARSLQLPVRLGALHWGSAVRLLGGGKLEEGVHLLLTVARPAAAATARPLRAAQLQPGRGPNLHAIEPRRALACTLYWLASGDTYVHAGNACAAASTAAASTAAASTCQLPRSGPMYRRLANNSALGRLHQRPCLHRPVGLPPSHHTKLTID